MSIQFPGDSFTNFVNKTQTSKVSYQKDDLTGASKTVDSIFKNMKENQENNPSALQGKVIQNLTDLSKKEGVIEYTLGQVKGTYTGALVKGKPDGSGTFVSKQFNISGNFKEGLPSGYAKMEIKADQGDFKKGVFEGQFINGVIEGKGSFKSVDGLTSYTGDFKNNLPHGKGTLIREGSTYEGHFENGLKTGYGVLTNSSISYHGNFEDDQFEGDGIWESSKDDFIMRYEGKFSEGLFTKGTLTVRDTQENIETNYEGEFKNGEYDGEGKLTTKSTLNYEKPKVQEGIFKNGIFRGDK